MLSVVNSLYFLSLKYGVRACEEEKNDKMKAGLGWIRRLRARSPYDGNHFSSLFLVH